MRPRYKSTLGSLIVLQLSMNLLIVDEYENFRKMRFDVLNVQISSILLPTQIYIYLFIFSVYIFFISKYEYRCEANNSHIRKAKYEVSVHIYVLLISK